MSMLSEILDGFLKPNHQYRGKVFWSWNGKLEESELRRQIKIFKEMGLGGFFIHSRIGLQTEYLSDEWFSCVKASIDEAEKQGLEAWLYDEDRWPSGTAGGKVTKNPDLRMRFLSLEIADEIKLDPSVIAIFQARIAGNSCYDVQRLDLGQFPTLDKNKSILIFRQKVSPCSDYYNGSAYLDTLNPDAVREFINATHVQYKDRFGDYFGAVVPGIFTDEPQHGGNFQDIQFTNDGKSIAWTAKVPEIFKSRYGYDILDHLPELFFDVNGQYVTPARHDYHDCITYLFVEAFSKQISNWCKENNLSFTGHVLMEELLSTQTKVVGDCMRFYEYMHIPGIDVLTQFRQEYDTAKQVSSIARQFDRTWRLTETYGCTGWDFSFAGHKAVCDWQAALGINLRCLHLAFYTTEGQAKRDYPASISYQSPWWDLYPKVEDYFARLHYIMTQGQEVRDLLVIHPIESMWMLCRKNWDDDPRVYKLNQMMIDLRNYLLAAHLDFDYGDEEILSRVAEIKMVDKDAYFQVGKARYKVVIIPQMITMRRSTLRLLQKFKQAGGHVIFAGEPAEYVDAIKSAEVVELGKSCVQASYNTRELRDAAAPLCRRVSICDGDNNELGNCLYLLREDQEAFYLFLCNTGHDFTKAVFDYDNDLDRYTKQISQVSVKKRNLKHDEVYVKGFGFCEGRPIELDLETGKAYLAETVFSDNQNVIKTDLPVIGSRVFIVPKKNYSFNLPKRKKFKEIKVEKIADPDWQIVLSENNNLCLDMPEFRLNGQDWEGKKEILKIDRDIRKKLGLPIRSGNMVQPWAQKNQNYSMPVELKYEFTVHKLPEKDLFLCIEQPELYTITLNDFEIKTDVEAGWWFDRSLKKLPVSKHLFREGKNEIRLRTDYCPKHLGLENIYLHGAFGVNVVGDTFELTALPETLSLGDWCKQGLPFYSGSVRYKKMMKNAISGQERVFLRITAFEGVAIKVGVNDKTVGVLAWPPYEIDITDHLDGPDYELSIEVVGSRRNSHGPFHWDMEIPMAIGPFSFEPKDCQWTDAYKFVKCGLMDMPELVFREEIRQPS